MAKITLRNGGQNTPMPIVDGTTVADVRVAADDTYGIDSSAKVFITRNGSVGPIAASEAETLVQDGDVVEFVKPVGSKG